MPLAETGAEATAADVARAFGMVVLFSRSLRSISLRLSAIFSDTALPGALRWKEEAATWLNNDSCRKAWRTKI